MNAPASRQSQTLRILGIDPGSRHTGFGIVESRKQELKLIDADVIRLGSGPIAPRLHVIFEQLSGVLREYRPDVMAIEEVFVARNARSALILGHARGAAMLAGVHAGLDVFEYSAKAIKLAVVGSGGADKAQVQHMMRVLLGLTAAPSTDASDALACAICHAHTQAAQRRLITGTVSA